MDDRKRSLEEARDAEQRSADLIGRELQKDRLARRSLRNPIRCFAQVAANAELFFLRR